jgi:hypothetical protein
VKVSEIEFGVLNLLLQIQRLHRLLHSEQLGSKRGRVDSMPTASLAGRPYIRSNYDIHEVHEANMGR